MCVYIKIYENFRNYKFDLKVLTTFTSNHHGHVSDSLTLKT